MEEKEKISYELIFVALFVVIQIVISVILFNIIVTNCEYIQISDYLHEQIPENMSKEYIQGWNDCISIFEDKYILPPTNATLNDT